MRLRFVAGALLILAACRPQAPWQVPVPLGLDLFAPVPEGGPLTPKRIRLGERLFSDPLLSADRSVSCSSCHRPDHAFSDTLARSLGVHGRRGLRNAPSLLNAAYHSTFFWDGRVTSLEEQVLAPIQDTLEMDLTIAELEARLRASPSYSRDFHREFGTAPSAANVARVLATYLRSLRSGDAAIDRVGHGDPTSLSAEARRGFELFSGTAGCSACHIGPLFADGDFHNTGVAWRDGAMRDPGRFRVTGDSADAGRFKTPSLRNAARTAPYMHDGSIATLDAVIEFYNAGGRNNPNLDPQLRPLQLTDDDKRALRAFLEALTSPGTRFTEQVDRDP